VEKEY